MKNNDRKGYAEEEKLKETINSNKMTNNDLSDYGGGERMTEIIDSYRTKNIVMNEDRQGEQDSKNETPEQRDSRLAIRRQRITYTMPEQGSNRRNTTNDHCRTRHD